MATPSGVLQFKVRMKTRSGRDRCHLLEFRPGQNLAGSCRAIVPARQDSNKERVRQRRGA